MISRTFFLIATCTLHACASAGSGSRQIGSAPADSAARAALAAEQGLAASGNALGVAPFRIGSRDPSYVALGFALADLLTTDLARSSQLQLVERSRLGEVLRELDLASSGRVDSATAPRVGRLVQARRLLLGGLDSLPGGEFRLSARVADIAEGTIEQAVDARAPLADALSAEKALAFRIFDALGVTLTPAERALIETRPTNNPAALQAYGRGVSAEWSGEWRRAQAEFERAAAVDPGFRVATDRAVFARATADAATRTASLLPGLRAVDGPVIGVVDRLNRPLDYITTRSRPFGGAGDPAFPGTLVMVVITIRRP